MADTEQEQEQTAFNFQIPSSEHREIKVAAARLGVTLAEFMRTAAKEYITRQFPAENGKRQKR